MSQPSQAGKTRAIIAHITVIGCIIATIQNNNDPNGKDDYASFYIRQMLGIIILSIIIGFLGSLIPVIGVFLPVISVLFWIHSLMGAVQDQKRLAPFLGERFQEMFKTI